MTPRRATVVLTVISTVFCAAALGQTAPWAADDIPRLIEALGHPDPLERDRAEKQLVARGSAAREPIRAAMQSEDPEIASRARNVLLRLPWALPGDSPAARQLLAAYGAPLEQRARVITQLAQKNEIGVLMRLLEEEPATELRWHIVGRLEDLNNLELARRLKPLPLDSDNAPAVFLAAKYSERTDRQRAQQLYRRVIELESAVNVPALNRVLQAYDELIDEAVRTSDFPAAMDLLREQAARAAGSNAAPFPVARILALHAYVGPLPGYGRDIRTMGGAAGRPVFADRIVELYEQLGLASPPPVALWAYANGNAPAEMRYWAGTFFFRHQMFGPAEHELSAVLARVEQPAADDPERGAPPTYDYAFLVQQTHELLSRAKAQRGDDLAAAEHLRQAVALRDEPEAPRRGVRDAAVARARGAAGVIDDLQRAEMHWRYLRAARTTGDQKKLREHLDVLKLLTPANTDIVLDVVPLLKETGQPEAARRMFDATYKELREVVDQNPDHPEPMNNLAWLCARSGERLPEALELATRAITLDPENAAYLDTAAEANFRVGNVDEAIRLETKGLQGRPNDKFMREQLERFRAAKK